LIDIRVFTAFEAADVSDDRQEAMLRPMLPGGLIIIATLTAYRAHRETHREPTESTPETVAGSDEPS
jgi:hypothetical protein